MSSISGVPANVSDGYVYNRTFCYQADEEIHEDFVNKTGEYSQISRCKIHKTVVVEQFGTKIIENEMLWKTSVPKRDVIKVKSRRLQKSLISLLYILFNFVN